MWLEAALESGWEDFRTSPGPSEDSLLLHPCTVRWGRGWFQGPSEPFIHCPQL